jgi:hypothetical protein
LLDSGFRIQDSGFRIQDSGFRIQDSGFRIQDSGFRSKETKERLAGEAIMNGERWIPLAGCGKTLRNCHSEH